MYLVLNTFCARPNTMYFYTLFPNIKCNSLPEIYYHFNFTDEKTEPLKDEIICSSITNLVVAEAEFYSKNPYIATYPSILRN